MCFSELEKEYITQINPLTTVETLLMNSIEFIGVFKLDIIYSINNIICFFQIHAYVITSI